MIRLGGALTPALGHTRRFHDVRRMSGLAPTADISGDARHYAFGPIGDVLRPGWQLVEQSTRRQIEFKSVAASWGYGRANRASLC